MLLPAVTRFSVEAAPARYAEAARRTESGESSRAGSDERARGSAGALSSLIPRRLREHRRLRAGEALVTKL